MIESSLGGLAAHRDSMQNLYVSLPQNVGGRPLVMLDAHTDEVGFMVQSITATGLLRIVPLGGWVEHNIPAHTFLLHNRRGETVRAVSTSKPPHFMTAAERSAPLSMESILLDAGVCSRKDATELLGLEPGLVAVPDVQFSYNGATGLMLGKAFDCRLGCAGVVEVLRALKDETLCADVTAAFSTQEEVGLRGAKITAERLRPALAICLEGAPADDNFTAPDEAQGALKKVCRYASAMAAWWRIPALWHLHAGLRKRTTFPTSARSAQAAAPTAAASTLRRAGCRRWCWAFPCAMRTRITAILPPQMSTPPLRSPAPSCARLRPTCSVCSTPWPDAYIKQSAVQ